MSIIKSHKAAYLFIIKSSKVVKLPYIHNIIYLTLFPY